MIAAVDAVPAPKGRSIHQLLENVSASRLTCFHQCRLKFYFSYVLALPRTATAALLIGKTDHAVLQFWNKARWRCQPVDNDLLRITFDKSWSALLSEQPVRWKTDETEEESKVIAWALLETYLLQTPIPANERPEGVEVAVEAELSKHGLPKLVGIIDLVRAGGRIVDFKTASQTPSPDKALHMHESQLSCYAIMYREATGHKESALELHHLVKLKTPKVVITQSEPMTERQQTRLFKLLESYVHGLECEDWVPNPNTMSCACCEYYDNCRTWA